MFQVYLHLVRDSLCYYVPLLLLLVHLFATAAASDDVNVSITPWCDNSFRVQIVPSQFSENVAASRRDFFEKLREAGEFDGYDGALVRGSCGGTKLPQTLSEEGAENGNLLVTRDEKGRLGFFRADTKDFLFGMTTSFGNSTVSDGFLSASVELTPGVADERIYGLGQGNWTAEGGCPTGDQWIVPLIRNGQHLKLQQRKFHVTIPFAYSSTGYGFLFNMPGYGTVDIGDRGVGGMVWRVDATAIGVDFWVSTTPSTVDTLSASPIYKQYADASGHAPPLREDAMIFWQSRNRYKSSAIALQVANRYKKLDLPVGVLVVDYHNQKTDGDYAPNPDCYPSVSSLSSGIREAINATTVFSFWPEVQTAAAEYGPLDDAGCLINGDLGGRAVDPTTAKCREMIWSEYLKPRYYDQGVSAYWLDETDGEGTDGGADSDGDCYDTSFGPCRAYNNLWVNSYLRMFSEPVVKLGEKAPLILTRGAWAGAARHGIVLWSSDIWSSFEELATQVPIGVHASLSGMPWWTTDVGGYGCGFSEPNDSPYMQELIVRWYEFGLFSPVFRTHGCRNGPSEPDVAPCVNVASSCGGNEVWSYGNETQPLLASMIRTRATVLKPYIAELSVNVSKDGVPTMRPLWWDFPRDDGSIGVDDQYMLGDRILVAPVTTQNVTSRVVYFPKGASWQNFWDNNATAVVKGGITATVDAPLGQTPAFWRV